VSRRIPVQDVALWKRRPRRGRWRVALLCAFGLLACLVHAQEPTPAPTLALSFEQATSVRQAFGVPGILVPGKHGQGLTGLRAWLVPTVQGASCTPAQGTVMAWAQLTRKANGGYLERWLKTCHDIGLLRGRNTPLVLDAKVKTQAPDLIETGDWRHWAFVWEGTARRLYLDGRLVVDAEASLLTAAPGFLLMPDDGEARWILDDFLIYDRALSREQIARLGAVAVVADYLGPLTPTRPAPLLVPAEAAPSSAVVYDARQLVTNPTLATGAHFTPVTTIPPGWQVARGKAQVTAGASRLTVRSTDEEPVSLLAELRRGQVIPGAAYQLGVRYTLAAHGAKVRLRFRNQVDQGTREFILPERASAGRQFFFTLGPEDYDVGIYYLEVFIQGAGAELTLEGAYCRAATPEEAAGAKLSVTAPAVVLQPTVTPDERWIDALPPHTVFVAPAARKQAWGLEAGATVDLSYRLTNGGNSLLFEQSSRVLWEALQAVRMKEPAAIPRLAVTHAALEVPGGYGLDPLPARSVLGTALLFGIGAKDTGLGSFHHQRLVAYLRAFGVCEPDTRFLPFWALTGLYAVRNGHESPDLSVTKEEGAEVETPTPIIPDFNARFTGKPDMPLFAHTAPGVLTSGYLRGRKLLLVMVNYTAQDLGKLGDVWIDHARLFGLRGDMANLMRAGTLTASNPESGARLGVNWNRASGGYIADRWANIGIAPGDFGLLEVEYKP
jgi:hypothetical protein